MSLIKPIFIFNSVENIDCKTVGFFLKISEEIGKACRKSLAHFARMPHTPYGRLSPVSLSVFSLVPDLLFDCSQVLEYAKIRTVLQSIENKGEMTFKSNVCKAWFALYREVQIGF